VVALVQKKVFGVRRGRELDQDRVLLNNADNGKTYENSGDQTEIPRYHKTCKTDSEFAVAARTVCPPTDTVNLCLKTCRSLPLPENAILPPNGMLPIHRY
jgi:hypothetical protein